MTIPPVLRPTCSRIILTKELGDAMQKQYELLYQPTILKKVKIDYQVCEIGILKNLLLEIYNQAPSYINGFRIYLGLDGNDLIFLFGGIIGPYSVGKYFQINPDGGSFTDLDDKVAETFINNYASTILVLPEIKHGLPEGNTARYSYIELLGEFIKEFLRHDSHSPIQQIKIKLSVCVKNQMHPEYIDRIVVGFSFMQGGNEINLPDLPGQYGCDMPKLSPLAGGLGADTGTPCPPSANCPK